MYPECLRNLENGVKMCQAMSPLLQALGTLSCVALVVVLRFRGDTISETLDGHSKEAWR